jgi:hypothetical protein
VDGDVRYADKLNIQHARNQRPHAWSLDMLLNRDMIGRAAMLREQPLADR